MRLDYYICDVCEKQYKYQDVRKLYPCKDKSDYIAKIKINLITETNPTKYNKEFDLCPDCMRNIFKMFHFSSLN